MRKILLALLAVAALGGTALVLTRHQDREERQERAQGRLPQFDHRRVTALVLTTEGADWRFARTEAGWRLESPVKDAGHDLRIPELLSSLTTTTVTRVIEQPEDALSAYGLDPPAGRVRLEGVDAPALEVGDFTVDKQGIFARVTGRPAVLVLEAVMGHLLKRPPSAFRDDGLTGLQKSDLTAVSLEPPDGQPLRLERDAQGWWITRPTRLPASEAVMSRMLEALGAVRVEEFLDAASPDDPSLGLGEGALRISLEGPRGARRLVLGAVTDAGLRIATRDDRGTVLAVDQEPLDDLPSGLDDLVNDRATKINRYQVSRFTYRKGSRSLTAVREGKDVWKDGAGTARPADAMVGLLARLLDAPVTGWRVAAPATVPEAVLEFQVEGGGVDRLELFAGPQARVASLPDVTWTMSAPPPEVP